jgi:hypothetical protein
MLNVKRETGMYYFHSENPLLGERHCLRRFLFFIIIKGVET